MIKFITYLTSEKKNLMTHLNNVYNNIIIIIFL